jgi:hypothetical protein
MEARFLGLREAALAGWNGGLDFSARMFLGQSENVFFDRSFLILQFKFSAPCLNSILGSSHRIYPVRNDTPKVWHNRAPDGAYFDCNA